MGNVMRIAIGLVMGLFLASGAALADGVYRLVSTEKHGAGQDYEQWSAQQRENLSQQVGYVPTGHEWSVGPGVGRIKTVHWQFNPSCPECVQQAHEYEGRHELPQTLPAGGKVVIPVSIRARITNWPADRPFGFAGGLEFSWWTSADRREWRYEGKKAFYADEVSGVLDARWEADVPDGPRYLILDAAHSNGILGGLGMRYLYELEAAAPAQAPPPAPAAPKPTPAPPPAPERQVLFFGEVTGIAGEALPHVRLIVTPSFAPAQTIASDASGMFFWRSTLPADTLAFTLAAEVELAADRDGQALFEVREHAQNRVVRAGSIIRMTLAPADVTRSEIAIARQMEFRRLAQGWFSANADGKPDGYLETTPAARAGGYSDVYRQLWASWTTAEQHFGESEALHSRAPLRAWVDSPVKDSHFNSDDGQPSLLLTPADSGHDDGARFAVLHEFGHYFDWATNQGRHRCDYAAKHASDHVPHRGYLNPSTADSFVEGFATWFAGEVQRHGPYARAARADRIAQYGSLLDPRRAYDTLLTSEELAIAIVLHRLAAADSGRKVWAALKPDRAHLAAYHEALRTDPPAGFDAAAVDRLFVEHGLYRQPFGNGSYDDWEPFVDDTPNNGQFDPGERWGDLHYADMERLRPLRETEAEASLMPGQSADASWTRDPSQARYSTAIAPGQQLLLVGQVPAAAWVLSEPLVGTASAYVVAVQEGRVPIAIPPGHGEGSLSVSVPGGRKIWAASYTGLRAQLATPAGRLGPLARVQVNPADHPSTVVEPIAVDGDPGRGPVREIGRYTDARESWPAELPARSIEPELRTDGDTVGSVVSEDRSWALPIVTLLLAFGGLTAAVIGWRRQRGRKPVSRL